MMDYHPGVFEVANEEGAKAVILTNEGPGADTETRWAKETPYVMRLISEAFEPRSDMVVLDYGCGIGRLAKAMIEATGCAVIGVDISASMRALAIDYVQSDRFVAVSPGQFDMLVASGLRVHACIVVWVLQHCLSPVDDILRIRDSLCAGASLCVLNMPKRAIPVMVDGFGQPAVFGWGTDDVDIAALLRSMFRVMAEGDAVDPSIPNMADAGAFWMSLQI